MEIKAIVSALALALVLLLFGCGQTGNQAQDVPNADASEEIRQETPMVEPTADEPAAEITPVVEAETPSRAKVKGVEITFDFTRMSTHASNQFAVWVEDANGALVKTLFVPNFTAARRGYQAREDAVPTWVRVAKPDAMSDAEIDAISGATPGSGKLTFSWDLTDANGDRVPDGIYTIKVEGTLYWSSTVLCTAELDTANAVAGELTVKETRSEPNNTENETMLQNVRITVVAEGTAK